MADTNLKQWIKDVCAGQTRAVAKMMSLAEATSPQSRATLAEIHKHTGHAHIVGLTGVPGSGKSTLVRALTENFRQSGRTVGIVAIDPSSPFSGGAILGDRVRMTGFSDDDGVFIRSMATRGALGGLARASLDTVDILDAAGFDVVLVETVGVGQDEVDIVQAAHTTVVVSAPGLGDDIQAIKAGVLEIADIHAVSKCDKPEAGKTVAELKAMLNLGRPGKGDKSWTIPVVGTSAEKGEGVEELIAAVDDHWQHLNETDELQRRRRQNMEMRIFKAAEDIVRDRLLTQRKGRLADLLQQVIDKDMDPHAAAADLLAAFDKNGNRE